MHAIHPSLRTFLTNAALASAVLASTTFTGTALADTTVPATTPTQARWQYQFTPYVWTSDLETTGGGSRVSSSSTMDFYDDLLPIVDAGWMSMFEARHGNWSIMNDIVYMKISTGAHIDSPLGFIAADVKGSFEQGTIDLMAGYTPDQSHTTYYAGLRYIFLDIDVKSTINTPLPVGTIARNGSRNEDWIDPVIGIRHIIPLSQQLQTTLQTNIGGGIDSEFSSTTTATLDYRLNNGAMLHGGYRYTRIDKDDSEILFDQTAKGIFLGTTVYF